VMDLKVLLWVVVWADPCNFFFLAEQPISIYVNLQTLTLTQQK
jgi:hypothetical protein